MSKILSFDEKKKLLQRIEELDRELDKIVMRDVYIKSAADMSELESESIALTVTSPPYGINKEYEQGVSFKDHWEKTIYPVLDETARVTMPGGKIAINVADIATFSRHNEDGRPEEKLVGHYYQDYLREKDFRLWARDVWCKDIPWSTSKYVNYDRTVHTDYRIAPSCEHILIFRKSGKRRVDPELERRAKLPRRIWEEYVAGYWMIRSVVRNDVHPSMFPEEIPKRLILMYSYPGDKVLDPFLGSGTTIKVARELGRVGIGYEKEEKYRKVIKNKLLGNQRKVA